MGGREGVECQVVQPSIGALLAWGSCVGAAGGGSMHRLDLVKNKREKGNWGESGSNVF